MLLLFSRNAHFTVKLSNLLLVAGGAKAPAGRSSGSTSQSNREHLENGSFFSYSLGPQSTPFLLFPLAHVEQAKASTARESIFVCPSKLMNRCNFASILLSPRWIVLLELLNRLVSCQLGQRVTLNWPLEKPLVLPRSLEKYNFRIYSAKSMIRQLTKFI